jgi:hypothetical protein
VPDLGRGMETDAIYYARRAREERLAAANAITARVRQCHIQLAHAYEKRGHLMGAESHCAETDQVDAVE